MFTGNSFRNMSKQDSANSPKTYQTAKSNASSNMTAAGYQEAAKSKYIPLFKFRNP